MLPRHSKCRTLLFARAMLSEEEEEEGSDYEEEIVVVELVGVPNPGLVLDGKSPCSILGLDTAEPVLQLGNYVFKGKYEDTLGTSLFFRENGKNLKYECASTKKLSMSRIVLKKRPAISSASASTELGTS